jgi:general L-amino acid transport system permease protein
MTATTNSSVPVNSVNPLTWLKKNLFSNWYNTLLTIVSLCFIYWLGSNLIAWALTQGQWQVISKNLRLFFVGQYPEELIWRPWTTLAIIVSLGGFSWGILTRTGNLFGRTTLIILGILGAACVALSIPTGIQTSLILLGILVLLIVSSLAGRQLGNKFPALATWLPLIWLLAFFVLLWLLQGGLLLEPVRRDDFSGLILTLFVAFVSIVLSFPLGVLLALGRQSSLPAIRWLSIAYIEIVRGLPLIGILFMAQVMLPLVVPSYIRPERVIRAIAGYIFFAAAYLAENVRGGLQAVPKGQVEAAKALGLNAPLVLFFIVLPQALRAVIPTIVGQFISLFKDTSLLAIVGLLDLLGISQGILANPNYLGRYGEIYLFIAAIYWVFCYSMALASRKLERNSDR